MTENKKVILSGIQPSGCLTLGNYIGALKNWSQLQDEYNCFYMVVDLHALTVRQYPAQLRERVLDTIMQYVACGLDPDKNTLFIQSHVSAHAELAWILNCYTYLGELSRMTQFKDKSKKHQDNINVGLFAYPVLMAADILLYQADLVPVGEDQRQHIEITRDVAQRFNGIYGQTFKVPEGYMPKMGARIMSLQDPSNKMSKSDENPNGYIALLDEPDVIMKKFKKCVTDSDNTIKYSDEKPGIKNLISIYSSLTGASIEQIEKEFDGKGYGTFKQAVAEVVIEALRPIQEKYKQMKSNEDYFRKIYAQGAQKAEAMASKTIKDVYEKVGLIAKLRG
jgi:tryptophanyl-tRNA synthetase